jgi:hypothetical protein
MSIPEVGEKDPHSVSIVWKPVTTVTINEAIFYELYQS